MRVSWYARPTQDSAAEAFEVDWPELVALLREQSFKGPKPDAPGWAPHFTRGKRTNGEVEAVCCLVLDGDKMPPEKASLLIQRTAGHARLVHTTASHTEAAACLRVIIPLSSEVPAIAWKEAWGRMVDSLGVRELVDGLKDPARFYYVPTANAAGELEIDSEDGKFLDPPFVQPGQASRFTASEKLEVDEGADYDLAPVYEALSRWSSDKDKSARARRLGKGEIWDPPGSRDAGMLSLVGMILGRFPTIPTAAVEHLFTASITALCIEDSSTSMERELEKLRDKVDRAREGALEHAEERLAEERAKVSAAAALKSLIHGNPHPAQEEFEEDVPGEPAGEKLEILAGAGAERMVDEMEEALSRDPRAFTFGSHLVRLVRATHRPYQFQRLFPASPRFEALDQGVLETWLDTNARFVGPNDKETRPPAQLVGVLLRKGDWPKIRKVNGFTETAFLRPDLSLCSREGYDPATGIWCMAAAGGDLVPAEPSRQDAVEAGNLLHEAVQDFPFADPNAEACWLAACLTPFVRKSLDGQSPIFVVTANTPGAGKTRLVDLISIICSGRPMAKMANTQDDEEMRKRLLALALDGSPLVTIDNIRDSFGTPSLDAALTSGKVKDRVLGESRTVEAPLTLTWFATGNNVILEGDMPRRALSIRLVSQVERPDQREGFLHPRLEEWAKGKRAELAAACLTILRGYAVAGCPAHSAKPWGSFEGWQRVVCGAVAWLGLPFPEASRDSAPPEAAESDHVQDFLKLLSSFGDGWLTAGGIVSKVAQARGTEADAGKQALKALCGDRGGEISARFMGRFLQRWKDRIVRGTVLRQRRNGHMERNEWRAETISGDQHQR